MNNIIPFNPRGIDSRVIGGPLVRNLVINGIIYEVPDPVIQLVVELSKQAEELKREAEDLRKLIKAKGSSDFEKNGLIPSL